MTFTLGDVSWSWFLVMPLGMAGFWALVIWMAITLVRDRSHDRPDDATPG